MIYLDASCLVKLFRFEPETPAVTRAVGEAELVLVSTLTELETAVQLKARCLAGDYSAAKWRALDAQLALLRNQTPYEFRSLPASLMRTALRKHRNSERVHCRTLDRLHLAAMEELRATRLMTHDDSQAAAARALGFEVLQPARR